MDGIIIAALLFVVFGLGAAMAAVFVVLKKTRQTSQLPEITTTATVLGVYSKISQLNSNFTSGTVDSMSANEVKQYYVDVALKGNQKKTFRIKKKLFMDLHDGDKGTLKYKGDKLIEFIVIGTAKIAKSDLFFTREHKVGPTVSFYGEVLDLGVSVMSKATVSCDLADLKRLFERLPHETSDWFFVLKRSDQMMLQAEKELHDEIRWTIRTKQEENVQMLSYQEALRQLEMFFKEV